MIFDTLVKPGRYDRKNKRLSRLSVKSAISRGSNSHQSPNMPIKYNDVDWTHINEQKTHERIEIKKKEFNLNKNKNIVYFSQRKRLQNERMGVEEDSYREGSYALSSRKVSDDKLNLKKIKNSDLFKGIEIHQRQSSDQVSKSSYSLTHTDSSPRFTSVKNLKPTGLVKTFVVKDKEQNEKSGENWQCAGNPSHCLLYK